MLFRSKNMESVVDDVMDNINLISKTHGVQTHKASAILVKNGEETEAKEKHDPFKEISARQVEENEQSQLKKETATANANISQNIKDAGGQLKSHMKSLGNLDSNMHGFLMTMIGALSTDDVVGQRLTHIITAISSLKNGLSDVISDFDKKYKLESIKHISENLAKEAYNSYTMEIEKKVYLKVYKRAP